MNILTVGNILLLGQFKFVIAKIETNRVALSYAKDIIIYTRWVARSKLVVILSKAA